MDYSPLGCKELDMMERLTLTLSSHYWQGLWQHGSVLGSLPIGILFSSFAPFKGIIYISFQRVPSKVPIRAETLPTANKINSEVLRQPKTSIHGT